MQFDSPRLNEIMRDIVRSDEKVLWTYEDGSAPFWYKLIVLYGVVFSLIWLGLALWIFNGSSEWPGGFRLGALAALLSLFILAGLVQMSAIVWLVWRWNSFAYSVTSQRVIVMNSKVPALPRTFGPKDLSGLTRSGKPNRGSVRLANEFSMIGYNRWVSFCTPAVIANIPEPKRIEELIYSTLVAPFNKGTAQ